MKNIVIAFSLVLFANLNAQEQIYWKELSGFDYDSAVEKLTTDHTKTSLSYSLSESELPYNELGVITVSNFMIDDQDLALAPLNGIFTLYYTFEDTFSLATIHQYSYSISYIASENKIVLNDINGQITTIFNVTLGTSDLIKIEKTDTNKLVLSYNNSQHLITDNFLGNGRIAIYSEAVGASFEINQTGYRLADTQANISVLDYDKNWVSVKSYDNAGTIKGASVSYYDCLAKPTQSQSRDFKTGKTWVSEIRYDSQGRPALSTFSAPLGSNTTNFSYEDNFIQEVDGSDLTMSELELDPINPPKLSTTVGTAGWYFSNDNTLEPFQDEADGRPYIRTIYDDLNSGKIRAVVGGKIMDVNSNGINDGLQDSFPQGFAHTMPAAQEMYYVFGKDYYALDGSQGIIEVLLKSYKSIAIDVDGDEVVSFSDSEGKTLASARSGGANEYEVLSVIGEQGFIDIHLPKNIIGNYNFLGGASGYQVYNIRTGQLLASPPQLQPGNVYRISHETASDGKSFIESNGNITHENGAKGIRYNVNYYDFSLNYYDDVGNLKSTTQPLGFNEEDAFDLSTGIVNHSMISTYNYNGSGELEYAASYDEGEAVFIYREDGQIRFSQNELQSQLEEFSYTEYDERGRPIESGVNSSNIPYFERTVTNDDPSFIVQDSIVTSGNSISKNTITSWDNSGFYSTNETGTGNFDISFQFAENTSGVVGVSETNADGSYTTVDYGMIFIDNQIVIINNGNYLTKYVAPYQNSDILHIQRTGNYLNFLKNDELVYQLNVSGADLSNHPSYILDGALNTQGAVVSNISMDGLSATPLSAQTDQPPSPDDWIIDPSNSREQVFTEYDLPDNNGLHAVLYPDGTPAKNRIQRFVGGNVSKTYNKKPETSTTWYSYDVYGRVEWMVQYINGLGAKTIDYEYDDATGEVKKVIYQRNKPDDQFVHKYLYNNVGQLITIETSRDNLNFTEHASYSYYQTGELKRTNLAQGLQGLDYVYTLGGQLKAINHPGLSNGNDPGNDPNDVFGLVLDYYENDYTRIGTGLSGTSSGSNRYDGNIKATRWGTQGLTSSGSQNGYVYSYENNNWLTGAHFGNFSNAGTFTPSANSEYTVPSINYDSNGNITFLERTNGISNGSNVMDRLIYNYDENSNRLKNVNDLSGYVPDDGDIKDQPINNYGYNDLGQLIRNEQDDLDYEYYTNGLVKKVLSLDENGEGQQVGFGYNDRGHRVKKLFATTTETGSTLTKTFYVRDASGQVMAIYSIADNKSDEDNKKSSAVSQTIEYPIYGLSRLGMATQDNVFTYEVADHLGNVRAIIKKAGGQTSILSEDFSSGNVPGWQNQGSNLSIDSENERLRVGVTNGNSNYLKIDFPTIAGHTYNISFETDLDDTTGDLYYYVGSEGFSGVEPSTFVNENGEYTFTYTAPTSETRYLTFNLANSAAFAITNAYYLDNIEIVDVSTMNNTPVMLAYKDYYPFGMPMPNRNVEGNYRYAYQGQEKDPETGMEAFEARLWDSRIGRWLTVDPAGEFFSPYLGMGNNPISTIDPDGRCTKCPNNAAIGDTYNHPEYGTLTLGTQGWAGADGVNIMNDLILTSGGSSVLNDVGSGALAVSTVNGIFANAIPKLGVNDFNLKSFNPSTGYATLEAFPGKVFEPGADDALKALGNLRTVTKLVGTAANVASFSTALSEVLEGNYSSAAVEAAGAGIGLGIGSAYGTAEGIAWGVGWETGRYFVNNSEAYNRTAFGIYSDIYIQRALVNQWDVELNSVQIHLAHHRKLY